MFASDDGDLKPMEFAGVGGGCPEKISTELGEITVSHQSIFNLKDDVRIESFMS